MAGLSASSDPAPLARNTPANAQIRVRGGGKRRRLWHVRDNPRRSGRSSVSWVHSLRRRLSPVEFRALHRGRPSTRPACAMAERRDTNIRDIVGQPTEQARRQCGWGERATPYEVVAPHRAMTLEHDTRSPSKARSRKLITPPWACGSSATSSTAHLARCTELIDPVQRCFNVFVTGGLLQSRSWHRPN